jgi:outer membrane protein OmpA-like peptidoglycan-associated protein
MELRMRTLSLNSLTLAVLLALPATVGAQQQPMPGAADPIVVTGTAAAKLPDGPEVKGIISARSGDKMRVTAADGTSTVIAIDDATRIRTGGLFGGNRHPATALMNGLPVTVKTAQAPDGLLATRISFRGGDLKTASMIHTGTDQRFGEQAAATEALRGRMGDIDQYNVKSTVSVYFDTGKAVLSEQAKADLCAAASAAEGVDNALMLVVGYTDSVGDESYNQTLSERRASSAINYLQQACRWKPYRMLTPTGMSEADPVAPNDTPEGKAQNRRVAVNVLVSKGLDGL